MGLLDISAADTIDGAGASQSSLNHTHSGRSSHTSTGLDTAQLATATPPTVTTIFFQQEEFDGRSNAGFRR